MKSSCPFLFIIILSIFMSSSCFSQRKADKYTDYDRGYNYWYYDNFDSAFYYFNRYVNNADDTLKKGSAYKFMGEIQWQFGDLYGAEENLVNALRTLDTNNENHRVELGYTYTLLGNVKYNSIEYDKAIEYYDKAIPYFKGKDYIMEIMNGKATSFQKKKVYNTAISIYDSILSLKPADAGLLARTIDNKAKTKWLRDTGYYALPEFWQALKIRRDDKNILGLNASYAHLSEYYTKSNRDSALWYAEKLYSQATTTKSFDDLLDAVDKLVSFNNSSEAKDHWHKRYKKLNDSFQLSRDTSKIRFALRRYDLEKSTAENKELKRSVSNQWVWIYSLIIGAVIVIAGIMFWNDKRKKRIKQDSENAIRNSKLKTSQKVHDVVANGLYGIMNELEHKTTIDKEPLINKIEDLYEKSRNISHEDTSSHNNDKSYDAQIHELLNAFSNDDTSIFIVGNQPEFWSNISPVQKQELQLVLKELMVNMKKHSGAKNVVVQFKKQDGTAYIHYKDDGVGFPATETGWGKGLKNTVSRINSLNGKVTFGKNDKGGASVAIDFPTQS
ncbi:ATP-binding protein [Ferruginibacter sp. HRS2-29]|uniref:tetratricopeptide repeat-containing sensor histidine kinase n=2 Tax=Ferruginibacter sp. HRS2-29 TaxID=2487334 RepID=UPI0020CDC67A|nr:ATP-binding protein [Ferruginibacter sp. HRS2-29]